MSESAGMVGVIGLGNMGLPMAQHLMSAGHAVVAYDVLAGNIGEAVASGARPGEHPADVGAAARVLITALPSEAALEEVVAGEQGLASVDGEGLVVIETSTLSIAAKERARVLLAHRGAILLDCPLSGTASQMRQRDVVVYASGDSGAIARCEPLLRSFSRRVYDAGEFGNGMRLKLVANHLVTIHTAAAAEALLLARRSGLDPRLTLEAVTDGAGTSRMLEVRGPLMLEGKFDQPNMPIRNYLKDVDLITAFGRAAATPMLLFALSAQLCVAVLGQGRVEEDPAAIFAVLEQMVGE